MRRSRRGQVTLEFLLVFGLMALMLVYSVRNTTFSQGSPSVQNLRVQVALEEKSFADAISNTINQVYAQGPGSKATSYIKLAYLRNPYYLEKAWGVKNSQIFVTYGYLPGGPSQNGTYVIVVNGTGTTNVNVDGGEKNAFWSASLYQTDITGNSTVWENSNTLLNITGTPTKYYGLKLDPSELGPYVRIVVEWNPSAPSENWAFDNSSSTIRIIIKPGG